MHQVRPKVGQGVEGHVEKVRKLPGTCWEAVRKQEILVGIVGISFCFVGFFKSRGVTGMDGGGQLDML